MQVEVIEVNLNTFSGSIPSGFDLVEYEKGTDPLESGVVLYGFDEVGTFFDKPKHCFLHAS